MTRNRKSGNTSSSARSRRRRPTRCSRFFRAGLPTTLSFPTMPGAVLVTIAVPIRRGERRGRRSPFKDQGSGSAGEPIVEALGQLFVVVSPELSAGDQLVAAVLRRGRQ